MKVNGSNEKTRILKMLVHLNRSGSAGDHNEIGPRHDYTHNTTLWID